MYSKKRWNIQHVASVGQGKRPTGIRKVMGSIPLGDSDFSLSHALDRLHIPSFLISSPS